MARKAKRTSAVKSKTRTAISSDPEAPEFLQDTVDAVDAVHEALRESIVMELKLREEKANSHRQKITALGVDTNYEIQTLSSPQEDSQEHSVTAVLERAEHIIDQYRHVQREMELHGNSLQENRHRSLAQIEEDHAHVAAVLEAGIEVISGSRGEKLNLLEDARTDRYYLALGRSAPGHITDENAREIRWHAESVFGAVADEVHRRDEMVNLLRRGVRKMTEALSERK